MSLAGTNRKELEKVLNYYTKIKPDKQKLMAAEFLISNMYSHFSYDNQFLHSLTPRINSVKLVKDKVAIIDSSCRNVYFEKDIVYDCQVISSDYLIHNIEISFQVWRGLPWGKNVSFEDFCEYILPYKIANEPIENWKDQVIKDFLPLLTTLIHNNGSAIEASKIVCNFIRFTPSFHFQFSFATSKIPYHLGFNIIYNSKIGYCRESCDYVVYVLRGLGIPSGTDFVKGWANKNSSHSWIFVLDPLKKTRAFDAVWKNVDSVVIHDKISKKGKVYRELYRVCNNFDVKTKDIFSEFFENQNLKDVSSQYFRESFSLKLPDQEGLGRIYLCVYNNNRWLPIAIGNVEDRRVFFYNIENGVAWLPCYVNHGELVPMSDIIIYINHVIKILSPEEKKVSVQLFSKFLPDPLREKRLRNIINGVFEGSNDANFTRSKVLHIINTKPLYQWDSVKVQENKAFRYVRYVPPSPYYDVMAEVIFYSSNGKPLLGKVIGVDDLTDQDQSHTTKTVFDHDPLTYYRLSVDSKLKSWVGLDLGKPQVIENIKYAPANTNNFVTPGDIYELFYFKNNQELSLGKTVAKEISVCYNNVPENALLILRNLSRGNEERIFTYENHQQRWW